MRHLWIWTSTLAVALVASAIAQPGQPRYGEGQGRPHLGRQQPPRLAGMRAHGMLASILLARPDVQKELNLTAQQKAKIDEMQQAMRRAREELRSLPPDQRRQRMAELRQKNDPTSVLTETQKKRLRELELQWQGPTALMDPEIAQEVGLTQEQQAKIMGIVQEFRRMRAPSKQGGSPGPQALEQAREETEKKILEVLTPAQRQKWDQMLGKPFTFEGGRRSIGARRGGQGFGQ
ncbi:MAG: hypothetical protein C4336_08670 [Armatimonadota bacterium]